MHAIAAAPHQTILGRAPADMLSRHISDAVATQSARNLTFRPYLAAIAAQESPPIPAPITMTSASCCWALEIDEVAATDRRICRLASLRQVCRLLPNSWGRLSMPGTVLTGAEVILLSLLHPLQMLTSRKFGKLSWSADQPATGCLNPQVYTKIPTQGPSSK